MSARTAGRTKQPEVAANLHRRSGQPSREQLYRENERLRRENEELRHKVAQGDQQIADAEKQIADLEHQLARRKRNSTTSSKPPSSGGLAGEQKARGRNHKSKRKPGGQPGHPGHRRPLVPPAEVDAVQVLLPIQCGHCGRKLPQEPSQVTIAGIRGDRSTPDTRHADWPHQIRASREAPLGVTVALTNLTPGNHRFFRVRLAPGAGAELRIERAKYVNQPTFALPWHGARLPGAP